METPNLAYARKPAPTADFKGPLATTTLQHSFIDTRTSAKSDNESYESDGLDDVPLATVMLLRRQGLVVRQGCLSRNSKEGNSSLKLRVRFAEEVTVRQDADEQLDEAYILKSDDPVVVKAHPRIVRSVRYSVQGYQQRPYLPAPALPRRLSSLGHDGRASMPQMRHNVHRRYNEAVTPIASHRRAARALASVTEEEQSQDAGRESETDEPRTAADLFHAHRQQALSSAIFDEPLHLLSPPSYAQLQTNGRVPRPVRPEATQYSPHAILVSLLRACLFVCSSLVTSAATAASPSSRYEDFASAGADWRHSVTVDQGQRDVDGLYIESLDMECDFFFGHQAYELPPQYQDVSVHDTSLLGRCLRRAVEHLW